MGRPIDRFASSQHDRTQAEELLPLRLTANLAPVDPPPGPDPLAASELAVVPARTPTHGSAPADAESVRASCGWPPAWSRPWPLRA